MKLMSNLKKKQICAAIICGLIFTGGQVEAEEANVELYGANSAAEIESPPGTGIAKGNVTTDSTAATKKDAVFTVTGHGWTTVYGGYSDSSDDVSGNTVTLDGTTLAVQVGDYVYGGYLGEHSNNGAVHKNTVIIKGYNSITNASGAVYGGYDIGTGGTVSGNTVIVEQGAKLTGCIYGGYSRSSAAEVSGNNVYIYGTVDGDVYGGSSSGTSSGNTVTLGKADDTDAKAQVKNLVLNEKGGKTTGGGILNVYNSGHQVNSLLSLNTGTFDLAKGATINFYINADDMNKDGTNIMLTVNGTGKAILGGVNIRAGVQNAGKICQGDKIVLLQGGGELVVSPELIKPMKASDGIMKADLSIELKGFDPTKVPGYNYANGTGKIIAIANADAEADLGPDSAAKSPVETMAASVSLINAGADMMAGEAMTGAAQSTALAAAENSASTMTPFFSASGSKTRVESGSHVDLKAWNVAVGFAKEIENKQGKLMFAPVIEYGRGSYDSYLDNGTHGDGTSSFLGIGVMAKQTNKDGLYYEGSLRGGRAKSDYSSNFTGVDNVNYDTSAAYYAMHLGVGKVVKLDEKDSLDCYGKLFYSHQAGDRAHLSNGYDYDFKAVDSIRTRLGVRYTHKINDKSSIYTGLAWQHEFDSEARATIINGGTSFDAPSPSIKGDTGIFELGWKIKPGKGGFETGLGLTGSVGKQRGIGLNAQFQWKF